MRNLLLLLGALALTGVGCFHSAGQWDLENLARRQSHIDDNLGPPTTVGTFVYRGRRCEIVSRVLPPHSIWRTRAKETLEQNDPITFYGVVDPDGPDPMWTRSPITYVEGVGAVALISSATGPHSGFFRDEVAVYDPSGEPDKGHFPPFKGFGWRHYAYVARLAGERACFFRPLYYRSPVDFDPSFLTVVEKGAVKRFENVTAVAVQSGGRWRALEVTRGEYGGQVTLPDGPICFFANEGHRARRPFLLTNDLRFEPGIEGYELAAGELDGWQWVLTGPSPANAHFLAIRRPDGEMKIPDGSLGLFPVVDRTTNKLVMWLVPYASEAGLRWGWISADMKQRSGPIWLDARVAPSATVYRPFYEAPNVVYFAGSQTYNPGGVKGHRAVIVVQALDRQWEVILPASPPLTPFGDGRLIRPTAEAAFNDSEARAKPVVAALETNLKGQRDAAWQHMLPAPKKGIDVENSDWDHFWFGTPAQPVIFHEWTNSIETRQREVIKQYQDRGVYDLYGRPFDYLNKR